MSNFIRQGRSLLKEESFWKVYNSEQYKGPVHTCERLESDFGSMTFSFGLSERCYVDPVPVVTHLEIQVRKAELANFSKTMPCSSD